MKYRKKPVVIEAVQVTAADWNGISFDSYPFSEKPGWLISALITHHIVPVRPNDTDYAVWEIPTLEGVMLASPGDWIIKGVKGELYPCKDEIFRATYDEVPE